MNHAGKGGHGGSASIELTDYWWYRVRSQLLQTILRRYVEDPARVLDVGSADGPSVSWLAAREIKVALDIDPRGLEAGSGVCGSAMQLPFPDATFEVVSAFDVIEHCEPEDVVVAELARVLVPGGRLLLSVPAYQWAWSDFDEENGHHRRYTRTRAVAAVEAEGLEVVRASYAFAATFPLFAVERATRRFKQAVRRHGRQRPADVVAVPEVSRVADRLLTWLGGLDDGVLRRHDLPFGSSVVVAARKPG